MGLNIIDRYSFLHFCAGYVANLFGIKFWLWFIIHAVFEILENSKPGIHFIDNYLFFWPGGKGAPDSLLNSISDQTFAMFGWYIASLL